MRSLLLAAAFLLGASTAVAAPPPDEVAKTMVERLQREVGAHQDELRRNPGKLYRTVDAILSPNFDLPHITQLVLARHWKTATPEQRDQFQGAFKGMLIRSYGAALLDLGSSGRIEWLPVKAPPDATDVTVRATVVRDSGPPLPIGLVMRLSGGDWKVYDILVESVSLVSSFRGQVGSQVRRGGIEAAIEKLESGDRAVATNTRAD
jgi:phospholipid transport system substrate-binding protein